MWTPAIQNGELTLQVVLQRLFLQKYDKKRLLIIYVIFLDRFTGIDRFCKYLNAKKMPSINSDTNRYNNMGLFYKTQCSRFLAK
jgi:hypothetical protein